MKKLSLLFLIAIVLFAFVSCSPESSSSSSSSEPSESTDPNLLYGEVTPPEEGERVAASDEDIKKAHSILKSGVESSPISYNLVVDLGEDGKISTEIKYSSSNEYESSVDGQIKIGGNVYKADKLIVQTFGTVSSIKSGSILKNEAEMTAADAADFVNSLLDEDFHVMEKFEKAELVYTGKMNLLNSEKNKVGTGTECNEHISIKDSPVSKVAVFDYTAGDDMVQAKISNNEYVYVALNGKFFDGDSLKKMPAL